MASRRSFLAAIAALALSGCSAFVGDRLHLVRISTQLERKLVGIKSSPGDPTVVRIFKETSQLEIWKRTSNSRFGLLTTFEICSWSGVLGPKSKESDRKAPAGFYWVTPGLLNPRSSYYLSFNTGFPNKFDRALGRTGTNLMVHGSCSSAGCYAMEDDQKEIYALARESFSAGNRSFQLQMFPFRMTDANLERFKDDANFAFWSNLKEGSDLFEVTGRPPAWGVCNGRYTFEDIGTGTADVTSTVTCTSPQPMEFPVSAPNKQRPRLIHRTSSRMISADRVNGAGPTGV